MKLLHTIILSVVVIKCVQASTDILPQSRDAPERDDLTVAKLRGIDQYDDNPDTRYYLNHGCVYLAQKHAEKYETKLVQEKQDHAYYRDCLRAVWPGHSFATLPAHECRLDALHSFKKGDVLAYPSKQPIMTASEDGFVLFQDTDKTGLILYHKDKPPMNLNVLANLPWPQDKDMLAFRDSRIKGFYASTQINSRIPQASLSRLAQLAKRAFHLLISSAGYRLLALKTIIPLNWNSSKVFWALCIQEFS